MSNNDYILFYSNKCEFCRDLITLFKNTPSIGERFQKVNIDNGNVKIPPYVKSVPTAILPIDGKAQLFVGKQIFQWYKKVNVKATVKQQEELKDWDPTTINGYSDTFSYLEDEKKFDYRSFSSINDNPSFFNPDPNAFSSLNGGSGGSNGGSIERGGGEMPNGFMDRDGGNGGNKNDEKQKEFLAQLEQYKNQRDSVVPQAPTRFG